MGRHANLLVTCAHCLPRDGSCCQCAGTRRVPYSKAEQVLAHVWATYDTCAACQRVHGMKREQDFTRGGSVPGTPHGDLPRRANGDS